MTRGLRSPKGSRKPQGVWVGPSAGGPGDNWPDTGTSARTRKGADAGQVSLCGNTDNEIGTEGQVQPHRGAQHHYPSPMPRHRAVATMHPSRRTHPRATLRLRPTERTATGDPETSPRPPSLMSSKAESPGES